MWFSALMFLGSDMVTYREHIAWPFATQFKTNVSLLLWKLLVLRVVSYPMSCNDDLL